MLYISAFQHLNEALRCRCQCSSMRCTDSSGKRDRSSPWSSDMGPGPLRRLHSVDKGRLSPLGEHGVWDVRPSPGINYNYDDSAHAAFITPFGSEVTSLVRRFFAPSVPPWPRNSLSGSTLPPPPRSRPSPRLWLAGHTSCLLFGSRGKAGVGMTGPSSRFDGGLSIKLSEWNMSSGPEGPAIVH